MGLLEENVPPHLQPLKEYAEAVTPVPTPHVTIAIAIARLEDNNRTEVLMVASQRRS